MTGSHPGRHGLDERRATGDVMAARREDTQQLKEGTMRRTLTRLGFAVIVGLIGGHAWAADIAPAVQQEIDRQIEVIKAWAADPALVKAVAAQNEKARWRGSTTRSGRRSAAASRRSGSSRPVRPGSS
jgi:hypothetical protein